MNIPAMYIVGLLFNLVFAVLCLFGYFFINSRTSRKWNFIIIFLCAWLVSALSYILLIYGMHAEALVITVVRLVSYLLFLAMVAVMIVELLKLKAV